MTSMAGDLLGELLLLIVDAIRRAVGEIVFRFYYQPLFIRILSAQYPYFTHLQPRYKTAYLRKVRDNYNYFQFVAKGTRIRRQDKVIIAAAATQLVFFLPDETLNFFTRIVVYPDFYESTITGRMHKGEVNPGFRLIVFSQRGIREGNRIKDDGINLLVHEFAHAIWLEHKLIGHQQPTLSEYLIDQFEQFAAGEMESIQQVETHFFRPYAFENMAEFFAVAVENFFERPAEFKIHQPFLFDLLVGIFQQNPLEMAPRAYVPKR